MRLERLKSLVSEEGPGTNAPRILKDRQLCVGACVCVCARACVWTLPSDDFGICGGSWNQSPTDAELTDSSVRVCVCVCVHPEPYPVVCAGTSPCEAAVSLPNSIFTDVK